MRFQYVCDKDTKISMKIERNKQKIVNNKRGGSEENVGKQNDRLLC